MLVHHFIVLNHYAVSEETCNEVESLVFDLFANLGATGALKFSKDINFSHMT